jgi:hypothetical protein
LFHFFYFNSFPYDFLIKLNQFESIQKIGKEMNNPWAETIPWPHSAPLGRPMGSDAQAMPKHGECVELPVRACTWRAVGMATGSEPGNRAA